MMASVPGSLGAVLGGLVLLVVILVPTGLSILRLVETLLRHRFSLSPVERVVLAFYAAGTLFFLLASIPLSIYGTVLVATVLILGTAYYAYLLARHRAAGWRSALAVARQPAMILLVAGFLGLLVLEVAPVWNHPFPNAWDGSATALWTNLILRQGTIPSSLQPFSGAPVVYPMGAAVWMTLPVVVLGWSVVQVPVLLPPLFLSFTVPATYTWGERWSRGTSSSSTAIGLLFAAFFGLVAGFPRLYTGGWYDFTLALPLLLLTIGWLPGWSRGERPRWNAVAGLGLTYGALTALSVTAGEMATVLLLAFVLLCHRGTLRDLSTRLAQIAVIVVFQLAFISRSLWAWAGTPSAAYVPSSYYGPLDLRLVEGELDPFVPWKGKLSPIPLASLELQILLGVGLVLAIVWVVRPPREDRPSVGPALSPLLLTGTGVSFVVTGLLLFTDLPGAFWVRLGSVTNLDQSSMVLFLFFTGLALLPLVSLIPALRRSNATSFPTRSAHPDEAPARRTAQGSPWPRFGGARLRTILVVTLLVVPLAVGAVTTVTAAPGYIESNVGKTSNVTAADIAALEWAGSHLPACSVVLVAPGSAAQFLPEYATVHLAFPMNPVPTNGSYGIAVANLTGGVYSSETRAALIALGVTEVFVTGQTSVSFLPFLPKPLESSPDFSGLWASGDAEIFGFLPILATSHCPG